MRCKDRQVSLNRVLGQWDNLDSQCKVVSFIEGHMYAYLFHTQYIAGGPGAGPGGRGGVMGTAARTPSPGSATPAAAGGVDLLAEFNSSLAAASIQPGKQARTKLR